MYLELELYTRGFSHMNEPHSPNFLTSDLSAFSSLLEYDSILSLFNNKFYV